MSNPDYPYREERGGDGAILSSLRQAQGSPAYRSHSQRFPAILPGLPEKQARRKYRYFKTASGWRRRYGVKIAIENLFDIDGEGSCSPLSGGSERSQSSGVGCMHQSYGNVGIVWVSIHANLMHWSNRNVLKWWRTAWLPPMMGQLRLSLTTPSAAPISVRWWEPINEDLKKKINYKGRSLTDTCGPYRINNQCNDALCVWTQGEYLLTLAN